MPAKPSEETDSESANSPMVAESTENPVVAEDETEYEDEEEEENQPPTLAIWVSSLEMLLYDGRGAITKEEKSNLNLVSHLLELYWNHASANLSLVLPPTELMERIQARTISPSVIYATCACVAKFSTHKVVVEPSTDQVSQKLSRYARQKALLLEFPQQRMDRLLIHCCLAEYEFNRGNGGNAWMDLAAGKGLLQIIKSSKSFGSDELTKIQKVEQFIAMMEAFYSLGTPSIIGSADHLSISSPLEINNITHEDDPTRLLALIHTLILIQQLGDIPLAHQIPPPWSSDSRFKFFRDELERYLLHWPNTYGFTASFQEKTTSDTCTSKLICGLIWHCCCIVLDRNFLPIPYRASTGESSNAKVVEFPQAPSLFLRDRIRRCEASAMAVPLICKEVIANGDFFRHLPLLGFSCMQSALVLINQSRNSSYSSAVMAENLRLGLAILLMTRNYFHPASNWVDALSHIQNDHTIIRDAADKVQTAFEGFYGRFDGISEPNFISLERHRFQRDPNRILKYKTAVKTEPTSIFQPPATEDQTRWTDSYVGFLETENTLNKTPIVADQQNLNAQDQKPIPPSTINTLPEVGLGTGSDTSFLFNMGSTNVTNSSGFNLEPSPVQNTDQENSGNSENSFFPAPNNPGYESEMWMDMLNQIMGSGESWADILSQNTGQQ